MLGLTACLVALPLARSMGYLLSYSLADILNFEIITTQLPWTFYAGWLLAGTLFPVLAAFFPVRHWSRVPVRDALDNYGVAQNAASGSLIDNLRLPLPRNFRLGLANGMRNPKRFVLGVGALTVGALAFMVTMNLKSSLLNTASIQESTILYDVAVAFEDDVTQDQINWITKFPFVTNLELWPAMGVTLRGLPTIGEKTYSLIGVPDDIKALLPNILKGHWISPTDPYGIVVSHRLMLQNPSLDLGDPLKLEIGSQTIEFTIRGINKQFSPP
jgi:ABC-type antimicrobial peptide transport system permease subunit